jgi:cytidine deaminase
MTDHALIEQLRNSAIRASGNAYSPYSGFRVGAAIADRNGHVYEGCNIENASFGLTQCAERNAIAAATCAGAAPEDLVYLVVYKSGPAPLPPCGACRQVMHEMMAPDSRVVAVCDSDASLTWSKDQYLPDAFEPNHYPRRGSG